LNCESIKALNDYTAFSQRLPFIGDMQCIKFVSGSHRQGYSKAVFGPGTELGISAAVAIADFCTPQIVVNALGGHGWLSSHLQKIFNLSYLTLSIWH
jgi:glucokinase